MLFTECFDKAKIIEEDRGWVFFRYNELEFPKLIFEYLKAKYLSLSRLVKSVKLRF